MSKTTNTSNVHSALPLYVTTAITQLAGYVDGVASTVGPNARYGDEAQYKLHELIAILNKTA